MFDILTKFAEMRKLERINLVRDFNLFPVTKDLLTLERKYGDSLLFEDINGYKQKKKRTNQSNVTAATDSVIDVNVTDDRSAS